MVDRIGRVMIFAVWVKFMDYGRNNVATLVDGKLEGGAAWCPEWVPVPDVRHRQLSDTA